MRKYVECADCKKPVRENDVVELETAFVDGKCVFNVKIKICNDCLLRREKGHPPGWREEKNDTSVRNLGGFTDI